MKTSSANLKLAQLIAIGTSAVSAFLLTGVVSDPVNVTKLFALGAIAVSAGLLLFFRENYEQISKNKPLLTVSSFFLISLTISLVHSRGPVVQAFYGAYGRNTGYFPYFLLLIILVAASVVSNENSTKLIFKSFMATGILNLIYCAWVLVFGDFIGWNNVYGNILGLFGNSDFISAFLGMLITGFVAILFDSDSTWKLRATVGLLVVLSFFEVYKSKAIQGFLVSAVGVGIISLLWLRSKTKSHLPTLFYGSALVTSALIAIFGMLQIGPASFIYKRSVSFRGTYWYVAEKMGTSNPIGGVGLDGYGDWYRRLRPAKALVDTPGPTITSNVAHNVVLDFFASGGWPLLVTYVSLILMALFSAFKVFRNSREYNLFFYALFAIWAGYQVQSFISINQIGLAVWGWVLTGVIIGYAKNLVKSQVQSSDNPSVRARKILKKSGYIFSPGLIAGIGLVLGALIAVPPLSADMNWMSALKSRNALNVEKSLTSTYLTPQNSMKYAQAVGVFQESNLNELALKYAVKATEFNPDSFDAWKQLYTLPNSSEFEKATALQNMKRLDPLNPDVSKP